MRHNRIEKLREASRNSIPALEKLEQQMALLNDHFDNDSELWLLARLLYVGQLVEQASLLYSLKALRGSQHSANDTNSEEKVVTQADNFISDSQGKIELDSVDNLDSISKITETERNINEH